MKSIFLLASILLPLYSPWPYIRSILYGETKPHRTTRFIYLIIGILTTLSLLASHNRVAVWISGVSTLQAIILFYLGLKHGVGGWSKTDIACLVVASIGIVAWQTTKNPILALYLGIMADFIGSVPTIIKSYRLPRTENWSFYGIDALAGMFNLLALTNWNLQDFAYPAYLVFINGLIALLILRGKHIKSNLLVVS